MPSSDPRGPATIAAGRLLHELADVHRPGAVPDLPDRAAADWAASGAMALTGRADGPPVLAPGAPASVARAALAVFELCTGTTVPVDVRMLGERAGSAGLSRRAPFSAGGAFRCLRTRDGWWGLSLAREQDRADLPALTRGAVTASAEPWDALQDWLAGQWLADVTDRAAMLGLAAQPIPTGAPAAKRPALVTTRGGRATRRSRPTVVDLTGLWAGPLCAHLLTLAGADVVKVESSSRPDGARHGDPAYFDLLHAGQTQVMLDLDDTAGRDELRRLVSTADVVLEASRPRALRRLGLHAEDHVAAGGVWLAISAYGRAAPDRVGFGDDVAAGAGLVWWDEHGPAPVGDALADPLTGLHAAAAVAAALRDRHGWLLDVSMHDVCVGARVLPAEQARVQRSVDGWTVVTGCETAVVQAPQPPQRRPGTGTGAAAVAVTRSGAGGYP